MITIAITRTKRLTQIFRKEILVNIPLWITILRKLKSLKLDDNIPEVKSIKLFCLI